MFVYLYISARPHFNRYVNGAVVSVIMWIPNGIVYLLSNNDAVVWFLHIFPVHNNITPIFSSSIHFAIVCVHIFLSVFLLLFFIHSFTHSHKKKFLRWLPSPPPPPPQLQPPPLSQYMYARTHTVAEIISFHLHNFYFCYSSFGNDKIRAEVFGKTNQDTKKKIQSLLINLVSTYLQDLFCFVFSLWLI